jgi:hypothetical protein
MGFTVGIENSLFFHNLVAYIFTLGRCRSTVNGRYNELYGWYGEGGEKVSLDEVPKAGSCSNQDT